MVHLGWHAFDQHLVEGPVLGDEIGLFRPQELAFGIIKPVRSNNRV
jgi:hypothetical protein